jgi:alcohol dehydrogenase class IV
MTVLDRIPRITQGIDAIGGIGTLAASAVPPGSCVMLVADPGLHPSGAIESCAAAIRAAGLGLVVVDDVESDPTTAQVDEAAKLARREGVAAVVALGGGSAMDVGKAVAAIAPAASGAEHYQLCANPLPPVPLRKICIPTTAGTGSETTRTAVFVNRDGVKIWLWGDTMKADEVVLDPTVTVGLPAHLTAATGIDALVHAIEASTNANAFAANDMYCHRAIALVTRHLARAVEEPTDLGARGAMLLAAALAGIGIDNAGTAVAHNIGHALASLRPVHHGRAVGLAMLATLPWNVREDDGRFAAVAHAMGESGGSLALPAAFERLLRRVGVKISLAGEGHDDIAPERLARQMAQPENASMRQSNKRPVADEDLLVLARIVLNQS